MPGTPPTRVLRSTPAGWKMPDGWQTFITFQNLPGFNVWEKAVKPVGFDGKEAIDTTTMHNAKYRTFAPRHLQTLTEVTATCAYDPDIYDPAGVAGGVQGMINVNQSITLQFPDHTTITFWGFLMKFELKEHKEGEFPEADITVVPTNTDTTSQEAAPVTTPSVGT